MVQQGGDLEFAERPSPVEEFDLFHLKPIREVASNALDPRNKMPHIQTCGQGVNISARGLPGHKG